MPTYEYKCADCGTIEEKFLPIEDREKPTEEPCVVCNSFAVRQKVTNPIGFNADPLPKLNSDFKDVAKRIKKANRGSNIPDY